MRECAMGRRSLNEGLELFREFSWRSYALRRSVRVGNLSHPTRMHAARSHVAAPERVHRYASDAEPRVAGDTEREGSGLTPMPFVRRARRQ
jgi:hypothetical protein